MNNSSCGLEEQTLFENLPSKRFKTIVIDPPWHYTNKQPFPKHCKFKGATELYPTLTTEQIATLPIQDLAQKNCHLYLWTLDRFIPDAYKLAEEWGFRPIQMVYWQKTNSKGRYMGLGYYFRGSIEPCLFCVKGSMRLKHFDQINVFEGKISKHSQKPDEFYRMVERVSPHPRIDMFARATRQGWTSWGNEIEVKLTEEQSKE